LQSRPGATRIRLSAEHITRVMGAADAGDERAWGTLVAEFGGMIWAVARAHRLCDADAAEVSQSTWLRLLEHLGQLRDAPCVGAWLTTTARRECLRVLRENGRRDLYGDDAPELVSQDASPNDAALLCERAEALWRSFSRLRASDQSLLRLLMADPRPSYEEVAAALDMPIGSIGPTRQRALERLGNELRSEGMLGHINVE
jgi:RNA polymerase sigma factor (sigma-70 family)